MKRTMLSLVCFFACTMLFAQSADDIVNKYIDAMGGKQKLLSIKNIYLQGTEDANGQPITVKTWEENTTAWRQEYITMGMASYTIITKDSGWAFDPGSGEKQAEPLTPDMIKGAQPALDIQSPLLNYKQKGYKLEYKGTDDVDGTDAYKLELTINDSLIITYFIEPVTYYIMRQKTQAKVDGKQVTSQDDFYNYQKTSDGYIFAMDDNSRDGGLVKYTVVKVNTDMDGSLFKPKR